MPADSRGFLEAAYRDGSVLDANGDRLPVSPHSIERANGEALLELLIAEGVERTIEVGLALGISALWFSQAVAARGGRHVAVDPFQQESWNGAGLRTLREAGMEQLVEVIEEDSRLALPRLVSEGREFDFAYVDGDHRFDGAFLDLYYMTRLVRPGGLIALDDLWMPSIRMAVAYAERNLELTLEPDALPTAFRWRRRRLTRGIPRGTGDIAVLRTPSERPELRWDQFVPPY
jgi:predicted O-methyltransferase YrrM